MVGRRASPHACNAHPPAAPHNISTASPPPPLLLPQPTASCSSTSLSSTCSCPSSPSTSQPSQTTSMQVGGGGGGEGGGGEAIRMTSGASRAPGWGARPPSHTRTRAAWVVQRWCWARCRTSGTPPPGWATRECAAQPDESRCSGQHLACSSTVSARARLAPLPQPRPPLTPPPPPPPQLPLRAHAVQPSAVWRAHRCGGRRPPAPGEASGCARPWLPVRCPSSLSHPHTLVCPRLHPPPPPPGAAPGPGPLCRTDAGSQWACQV